MYMYDIPTAPGMLSSSLPLKEEVNWALNLLIAQHLQCIINLIQVLEWEVFIGQVEEFREDLDEEYTGKAEAQDCLEANFLFNLKCCDFSTFWAFFLISGNNRAVL